jgi:hypothetical protein
MQMDYINSTVRINRRKLCINPVLFYMHPIYAFIYTYLYDDDGYLEYYSGKRFHINYSCLHVLRKTHKLVQQGISNEHIPIIES